MQYLAHTKHLINSIPVAVKSARNRSRPLCPSCTDRPPSPWVRLSGKTFGTRSKKKTKIQSLNLGTMRLNWCWVTRTTKLGLPSCKDEWSQDLWVNVTCLEGQVVPNVGCSITGLERGPLGCWKYKTLGYFSQKILENNLTESLTHP